MDDFLTGAPGRSADGRRAVHPRPRQEDRGRLRAWGIALNRNGLCAVGRCAAETGPRVFAVESFISADRRARARFEVPGDFSLAGFFAGAFGVFPGGEVERNVVELDRAVATIVESRRHHPSQRATRLRDGRVRELELAVTPDVVSCVVGWGDMVRVRTPEAFAVSVAAEHRHAGAGRPETTRGKR